MIFVTVVIGIASLGNLARAGGLALRSLAYFFSMTIVALALGLIAANVFHPGSGFDGDPTASAREAAKESIAEAGDSAPGLVGFITDDLLPTSFVSRSSRTRSCASSCSRSSSRRRSRCSPNASASDPQRLRRRLQVIFGVIRLIMWAAPLGAFGGMAYTISVFGAGSLTSLAALMAVFWGTCAFFVFVVLGAVARASGFSIFRLVRLIRDELLIIVGTSSSETVLPRLLAKLQAAGASKQVTGMVIPTGYSFNLDGTCIYLTLGALFIVQASGQDMAIGEQIALARPDDPHLQGRRGHHRRRPGHAHRLAAGLRWHVLHRRSRSPSASRSSSGSTGS